jgi:hypothetical protein
MSAGPPYAFYEVYSCYALAPDGRICQAGSRLTYRPPGAQVRVEEVASRALGSHAQLNPAKAAQTELDWTQAERLFDGAITFWQVAPLLAAELLRPLFGADGHADWQVELKFDQTYRLTDAYPVLADNSRLWISLTGTAPEPISSCWLQIGPLVNSLEWVEPPSLAHGQSLPSELRSNLDLSWKRSFLDRSELLTQLLRRPGS